MNTLTLHWHDGIQDKFQNIYQHQPSKNPHTVRIGRNPSRCDIVLSHPTVSGLHVEIFFHTQQQCFYMRNLRSPNPPLIDGKQLFTGEMPLKQGSIIYLGQVKLQVTNVTINNSSPTIVTPPRVYGLECPKCHKVSPLENLHIGCPWCGTSLAAAASVLVPSSN